MFKILIATHGTMSDGVKDAVGVIVGMTDNIETVNLLAGAPVEALGDQILEQIQTLNTGDGVIIFTDLVSASPYNQSILAINQLPAEQKGDIHIIGGFSLPMVIEAINQQLIGASIDEAVQLIAEQGPVNIGTWNIKDLDLSDDDDEDDDF